MNENKLNVVVVFGTDAVDAYSRAWDDNEQVSESKLEELGCVVRRSFETKEELNAYMMGISDSDGWLSNIIANEENLKA